MMSGLKPCSASPLHEGNVCAHTSSTQAAGRMPTTSGNGSLRSIICTGGGCAVRHLPGKARTSEDRALELSAKSRT